VSYDAPSATDDTRYLDELVELWGSHQRADLEVRHRTGQMLNKKFDDPTKRQKRGAAVLKQASERLNIAVSELSRMRNFAHHFPSLDEFVQRHGAKTWTEVKDLLPALKAEKQEGGQKRRKNTKRFHARYCKRIDAMTKRLEEVEANDFDQPQREAFKTRLQEFAAVARTRLGIVVTVGEAL
jgi:Txe/YoeB family toxin of Txe-Axe toxin-antitoxin module